jgi:hypothetical protein
MLKKMLEEEPAPEKMQLKNEPKLKKKERDEKITLNNLFIAWPFKRFSM